MVTTGMLVQIVEPAAAAEAAGPAITVPGLMLLPGEDLLVATMNFRRMLPRVRRLVLERL